MKHSNEKQMYKPSRLRRELFAAKRSSQKGFFETLGSFSLSSNSELEASLRNREYERLVSMVDY